MRRTTLPHTSLSTSHLGFGTAALTSLNDRRRALRLLETAFDSGITHFDTARLYGFGQAEAIVGEFIRGRRGDVTIATKFGLEPPAGIAGNPTFISLAKRLVRRAPFLRKAVRRRAATMVSGGKFTPDAAGRSLETSLRELGTDYIDLLLLHECTLEDARRDDLIDFLTGQVSRGTIRALGIATAADKLGGDAALFPSAYRVIQLQNNVLDPRIESVAGLTSRDIITHSAFAPMARLLEMFTRQPALVDEWRAGGGGDPRDPSMLAPMLLAYAAAVNPGGIVLFSTTHPERIQANVDAVADDSAIARALRFGTFARSAAVARAAGRPPAHP